MNKYYISFGQGHTHSFNGHTLNKDTLLEIQASDIMQAREFALSMFDRQWSMIYTEDDVNFSYFPRLIHGHQSR